jgi:hypothetical protein
MLVFGNAFSQYKDSCNYNIAKFYKFVKNKDYHKAYEPWKWCYDNCPNENLSIYTVGEKIVEYKYLSDTIIGVKKEFYKSLIDSIYIKRIQYFPQNLAKIYNLWASSLDKRGAPKDSIFKKIHIAYNINPSGLNAKNSDIFFKEIVNRYKLSHPEKVIETYNNLTVSTENEILELTKQLDSLKSKEQNLELNDSEKKRKKNLEISLKNLGYKLFFIEDTFFNSIYTDCSNLTPLYNGGFKKNENNYAWLQRAYTKLSFYECTENDIFRKIEEAYLKLATPSDINIMIICKVQDYPNRLPNYKKMLEEETDPYIKADYLYKIGMIYRIKSPHTAASYAKQALKYQPNMGKAYLLIASAYARSAYYCGNDEFSKRMVYVAAAEKAKKAKEVDPSLTALANKYIKSYMESAPSTKLRTFHKTNFHIGCWINETVKIP